MIPIYRAKKIDSDEYVEGYYLPVYYMPIFENGELVSFEDIFNILQVNKTTYTEIDTSTLSIHFQNMLDKNGKKIFASLSEDGVGGDECKSADGLKDSWLNGVIRIDGSGARINNGFIPRFKKLEVVCIHKG